MDDEVRRALRQGGVIDITTIGRRTGEPRRIEIVFHVFGGRIYITGMAGGERRRSWLANLEADPRFAFHLKGPVRADLAARARIIDDDAERRTILREVVKVWTGQDLETMVAQSPLVEVTFEDLAA